MGKGLEIGNLRNEGVYVQGGYLAWKVLSVGIPFLLQFLVPPFYYSVYRSP